MIRKEKKEKQEKENSIDFKKVSDSNIKFQLKDTYLPKYLGLFDFLEEDKKRYKSNNSASMRDLYLHYKYDKKQREKEVDFTYADFREIVLLFTLSMVKDITELGYWYKLPYGLGAFGISKFTPRYYKPRFKKEGVELYNNPHSNGFVAKFSWKKDKLMIENKGLFRHKSVAHLKSSIAAAIFEKNADSLYYEIPREEELLTYSEEKKMIKKSKKNSLPD